jgi:hypothetical protein
VVPLRWFHREMFQQKRILLREADRLSVEIVEIQRNLAEGRPEDEMKALKELVEQKTGRHTLIEKVPTWPIDFKATRIFSIGNFVLLIPLVSEWTGLSKPWAEFIKGGIRKNVTPLSCSSRRSLRRIYRGMMKRSRGDLLRCV